MINAISHTLANISEADVATPPSLSPNLLPSKYKLVPSVNAALNRGPSSKPPPSGLILRNAVDVLAARSPITSSPLMSDNSYVDLFYNELSDLVT
jgi:hypothetical protein